MMKLASTVAALALAATSTTAHAAPKRETTALTLAASGTAASLGMIAASGYEPRLALAGSLGLLVAPSFGHWYAEHYVTRGFGLRLAGVAFAAAGLVEGLDFSYGCAADPCAPSDSGGGDGDSLIFLGALVFLAGTVDDFVTTPDAVRRHNVLEAYELQVTPLATKQSAGFALSGRF